MLREINMNKKFIIFKSSLSDFVKVIIKLTTFIIGNVIKRIQLYFVTFIDLNQNIRAKEININSNISIIRIFASHFKCNMQIKRTDLYLQ